MSDDALRNAVSPNFLKKIKIKTTSPNFFGDSLTKPSLIQTVLDYKILLLASRYGLRDQYVFCLPDRYSMIALDLSGSHIIMLSSITKNGKLGI